MGGGHRARGWGATVWGGLAPRLGQPSCFESGGGDASRRPAPRGVAARTSLLRTEHPQRVHERPSNQRGGGCCALVAASAQHVARRAASDKRSGGRTLWWGRCGAALPLARRCLVPLHWEAHLSAAGSAQERCEAGGQGAERARSLVTFRDALHAPALRASSDTPTEGCMQSVSVQVAALRAQFLPEVVFARTRALVSTPWQPGTFSRVWSRAGGIANRS